MEDSVAKMKACSVATRPTSKRNSATPIGSVSQPMAVAFFLFEVGLVATLQAFIFATLTAIYLGGAVAAEH